MQSYINVESTKIIHFTHCFRDLTYKLLHSLDHNGQGALPLFLAQRDVDAVLGVEAHYFGCIVVVVRKVKNQCYGQIAKQLLSRQVDVVDASADRDLGLLQGLHVHVAQIGEYDLGLGSLHNAQQIHVVLALDDFVMLRRDLHLDIHQDLALKRKKDSLMSLILSYPSRTYRNTLTGEVDQQLRGISDLRRFLLGSLDQNQRGMQFWTRGEYDLKGGKKSLKYIQ